MKALDGLYSGVIDIDWETGEIAISIRGADGASVLQTTVSLAEPDIAN